MGLSQRLTEEILLQKKYLNQINQARDEIKQKEGQIENERVQKETLYQENQQIFQLLGSDTEPVNNIEHLRSLLRGQNLYRIIRVNQQLGNAINQLLARHQVNSLKELSQKIIQTEQELANELN